MQYAVIATGGKQYLAIPGKELVLETLPQLAGETLSFDQVLLTVDGEAVTVGMPTIAGLTVTATVVRQDLADKIKVFKYRPKSRYRRAMGHRQHQTVVRIEAIGAVKPAAKKQEPVAEPAAKASAPKAAAKPRAKKETKE